MGAKISVLGMMLYFPPYLRSAMVWFPLVVGGGSFGVIGAVFALVKDFREVKLTSPPELAHCGPPPPLDNVQCRGSFSQASLERSKNCSVTSHSLKSKWVPIEPVTAACRMGASSFSSL